MSVGPWYPYFGSPPKPQTPHWPNMWQNTRTPVVVTVPRDHKCTVKTSPHDRKLWLVQCRRCGFSTSTRWRGTALDDALGHRYFARDYTLNAEGSA